MKRVNIGCGMTPTNGWHNYDNSFSVKLSQFPIIANLLHRLGFINESQLAYISYCRNNKIQWADVTKKIPLPDNSVEVLYSSHMFEHLDRNEAIAFLNETRRVLSSAGIVRLVVPDIEKMTRAYISDGDADVLIESAYMCVDRPRTIAERLGMLIVGTRHHQWMYDGKSLCKLLASNGFVNPKVLVAGDTQIRNELHLDLFERQEQSVYVEAIKQ